MWIAVAVAVLVVPMLSACGGGNDGGPSPQEYGKQLQAVCTQQAEGLKPLVARLVRQAQRQSGSTGARKRWFVAHSLRAIEPTMRQVLANWRAVPRPSGIGPDMSRYFTQVARLTHLFKPYANALLSGVRTSIARTQSRFRLLTSKTRLISKQYGLLNCATGSSSSG